MLPIQVLHVPLAYANGLLYFKVDQKYGRWTCAFVVQWATVSRWAYEMCKTKAKWRRIPYVTKKHHHHHHHHKHRAHSDFQQLLQSKRCKIVLNRMIAFQATWEMNPTPTLLIMTVTVVTVTMKCTPGYPKYRTLNLLHVMAYYK